MGVVVYIHTLEESIHGWALRTVKPVGPRRSFGSFRRSNIAGMSQWSIHLNNLEGGEFEV
jgi:hypothetical protein